MNPDKKSTNVDEQTEDSYTVQVAPVDTSTQQYGAPAPGRNATIYNEPNSVPPKKNKKKIIIVASLFLFLSALAVLFYVLNNGESDTIDTSNEGGAPRQQTDNLASVDSSAIADRLSYYQAELSNEYPEYIADNTKAEPLALHSESHDIFVYVDSPKDWSFSFGGQRGSSLDSSVPYGYLNNLLITDGFYRFDGKEFPDNFYGEDKRSFWSVNDVVCKVDHNSDYIVNMTCARTQDAQAEADTLAPFYLAYHEVDSLADISQEDRSSRILWIDKISRPERFPQYEVADGRVSNSGYGAAAYYYQISGGKWVYTHGGHDSPSCDLGDDDAHKAYHDKHCYGNTDETTTFGQYHNL